MHASFNHGILLLCLGLLFTLGACQSDSAAVEASGEALFVHEVLPVLEAKCFNCHGDDPDEIEGGLDLRARDNLLKGGDSGEPAIIANRPEMSRLYQAIQRTEEDWAMPPKIGDRLLPEEVEAFHDWIVAGAPWPDAQRIAEIERDESYQFKGQRLAVRTSGGLDEVWDKRRYRLENLWAYLPLQTEFDLPEKVHPVDYFLQQKREEHNLQATGPADKRTLLRRATFDLTGLPPTPEEIETFLQDDAPDAFERVVERLLTSPYYGEQWGRHWLDVVRYADSDGFSNDYSRPNAWRYRDYVIRSFNADKPFDQFAREQLAGDELDPGDPELLVATGFLRMGPWEHTSMSVAAETRQYYLDDVTNIVGEAFLATPLSCAKCHDHKYDPIPTKDYYRIQAVFATTQFADRPAEFLPQEEVDLPHPEQEQIARWIEESLAESKRIADKEEEAAKQWYKEQGRPYLPKNKRRKLPDDQQPPRYLGLTFQDLGYRKVLSKRRQTLDRLKSRFEPLAFSVYNGPDRVVQSGRPMRVPETIEGEPTPTFVLTGGSVYAPAVAVEPGVLSVINGLQSALDAADVKVKEEAIPTDFDGRRLAFAEWLTDPQNPLFARTIVNRVWQYHFGKGIAENPNNFGSTGKKPTHPELLDWLANYLIDHDWSLKSLHRLLMSSEAYQLASRHPKQKTIDLTDPDNELLTYFPPRRLVAEELRDAMLYLSGELNPKLGGFPIRPEINQEVALQPRHIMGSIAPAYQPSPTPDERNRRTIYAERFRTFSDPNLEVFNQPGSELSCERRVESTVATQAFALFNSRNTHDRALALAHKLEEANDSRDAQIQQLSREVWGRAATSKELKQCREYLAEMEGYHRQHPPEKIPYPTEVEREMFEEMTGQSFTYTEKLDVYENYTPDLKPWDVKPEMRALADLVVVFFNSNEFVYVY